MDDIDESESCDFKEDNTDEPVPIFPIVDIKEEPGQLFYGDETDDAKDEGEEEVDEGLSEEQNTDNDISDSGVVIKQENEADTVLVEPPIPAVDDAPQKEASLFVCGGLIPEEEGESFVRENGFQIIESEQSGLKKKKRKKKKEDKEATNPKKKPSAPRVRYRKRIKIRKHQCPHCNFTTPDIVCLEKHTREEHSNEIQSSGVEIATHSPENPRQCPLCEYIAVYPSKLKMHMMSRHTGEKPHQCPYCDHTALMYHNLKTHIMARHEGEKPHQCPHCDYTALKKYSVKIHIMARHTGEKPHQCSQCDYKSVTISCLKKHVMTQHLGEKPLQCPHCEYKSVSLSCLKEHIMALHLGEKPHQCPHCDYKATQKSNLKSHIKYVHKDLND